MPAFSFLLHTYCIYVQSCIVKHCGFSGTLEIAVSIKFQVASSFKFHLDIEEQQLDRSAFLAPHNIEHTYNPEHSTVHKQGLRQAQY